jgi:hypothetical protein
VSGNEEIFNTVTNPLNEIGGKNLKVNVTLNGSLPSIRNGGLSIDFGKFLK